MVARGEDPEETLQRNRRMLKSPPARRMMRPESRDDTSTVELTSTTVKIV
jgi:hypothetical protein